MNRPHLIFKVKIVEGFVVGCFAGQSNNGTVEFWRLDEPPVAKPEAEVTAESNAENGESTEPAETEKSKPIEQKPFHVVKVDKAVRGLDFTPDGRRFTLACADDAAVPGGSQAFRLGAEFLLRGIGCYFF